MNWNCSSIGLLTLLLICAINAAVINLNKGDVCSNTCSGKETIFKFEKNKIYIYNFNSKHSIKNPNSKEETLQLQLQGKAKVSKISDCDFGLLLTDVNLKEFIKEKPTMNKEYQMMKTLLEKYSLRFGYDNGRITGVCQDNMDNEFAVNIKKGILSSLQVSLDSLDTPNYLTETDIAGDCITEYTTKSEPPNFVIITKKKSIAGCARKSKYFTTISGRLHEQPKESRNLALLDGSYSCEIKVKRSEGLMESICQETHTFKPIKSEKEGSQILINQELRFDSKKDGNVNIKVPTTRSDLTMQHGDKEPLSMKSKLGDPKSILQEVCSTLKENKISSKITELFLRLIRSMSETSYEDVKSLDKHIEADAVCGTNQIKIRNFLLDVLSNVKTDAAFKFLIEDAKIYKFSKLGFSIFDNPTPAMIATLTKILADSSSYNTVSTLLSSMIKSFCDTNPKCMLNPEIMTAMKALTNNIGNNCHNTNKKEMSKIFYSLRALNNAGSHYNFEDLIKTLKSCISTKSGDDDIKVYSVQVFRQFPCNENIDTFLWTIFDDVSFNSEVRIESYLSLVRCPTRSLYGQIIQKLRNEQSQQLGSFIWSHISNLMESSDRFKRDIRDMLQIYTKPISELEKKFNLDFRSYSKNIEKMYQKGYSAAKIDTNIIFSSSQSVPSSVNINATVEIFGRSINLFEIGMRGKGISEKLFGQELNVMAHKNVHPDVKKMHQKITKNADKLSVSLYSKIMGREVYFSQDLLSDLANVVISLSGKTSFERSLLLLDTTVSVASITGFPVELQIESAASVNFNFMKTNNFEVLTKSNYAIQLTGKLLVNAHCTKIGVQTKGVISKDFEFGGKLKFQLNDGESVMQFVLNKMPDNSKLFSISNELSLIHKLEKVQTIENYDINLEKCTGEGAMKVMGLKVCMAFKVASKYSSYFPNMKADITFEKFSGINLMWTKKYSLKPIRKLKTYLLSASFPGAEEDTFRFKIDRDPSTKRQTYELLLWKKLSYIKFEINDKKISGELKSGKTEATLSGVMEDKGIFASEMNVDIKSGADTGKLNFFQKFTKEGPEVILKVTKNGDNGFNLLSNTKVRLTGHKIYNFFQRFRHSTNLKYSGKNEMSLIIESSRANKPLSEVKSKVEMFWKTKTKRNFYVNQVYLWKNVIDDDVSDLFGKVSGRRYSVKLYHEIEVNNKKFNVTNNFAYFISGSKSPALFMVMFKREDLLKKETLFELKSRVGFDLSNILNVKINSENLLNYPAMKINRKFNSKLIWKLNQLGFFDIDAEFQGTFAQLLLKHKFTSPQTGTSSAELTIGDNSYKLNSLLDLPKGHTLLITWPGNNIEINSKVTFKESNYLELIINHDLKLNNKLVAKVINTGKYNSATKEITLNSVGKTSEGKDIYTFDYQRKANYDITSSKLFFDYTSKATLSIPGNNFHKMLTIEQFADIDIDGKIKIKSKSFKSKMIIENLNEPKIKYGYDVNINNEEDKIKYKVISLMMYSGSIENKIKLKGGIENKNVLLQMFLDFNKNIVFEFLYSLNFGMKKVDHSVLLFVNSKNSPNYNLYYKRNLKINWEKKNAFSLNWDGEIGKYKHNMQLFKGIISGNYEGFKKVNFIIDIENPFPMIMPITSKCVFDFSLKEKSIRNYQVKMNKNINWKMAGNPKVSYELDFIGNSDGKSQTMDMNLFVTEQKNQVLKVNAVLKLNEKMTFDIKSGDRFATLKINLKNKVNDVFEIKGELYSSNELLKELQALIKYQVTAKTLALSCNLSLKAKLDTYTYSITYLRKIDMQGKFEYVDQIQWKSNIPYIGSGSTIFGFLLQNKIVQCNSNLLYQEKNVYTFKMDTSDIKRNLNLLLSSDIKNKFKFQTKFERSDTAMKMELDSVYNERFFKISEMKISYKQVGNILNEEMNVVLKSSNKALQKMTIKTKTYVDLANPMTTFTRIGEIKLNENLLEYGKIDLINGIIEMKSNLGKYITQLGYTNFEMLLKYNFISIRNFMFEYKSVLNEKPMTKLNFVYFRALENEPSKKVDTLGEAMFYLNVIYNRYLSSGKITLFLDKNKKSATAKMQADLRLMNFKLDEMTITFGSIKGSDNIFTGEAKYKDFKYGFTYEKSTGYKRKLQLKANDKSSKPQEMYLAFDFNKDYMFKLSADDFFDIDVALKSLDANSRSGTIKFIYNKMEIMNFKKNCKIVIPATVTSTLSFIKALIGMESGLDLTWEVDGKLVNIPFKSKMTISHVPSTKLSGGIKSDTYFYWEFKKMSLIKMSIQTSFDRNLPMFHLKEEMKMETDGKVNFKKVSTVSFISWMDVISDQLLMTSTEEYSSTFINNKKMTKANYNSKRSNENKGIGFEFLKETLDISLYKADGTVNATFETNVGYMIKKFNTYDISKILPIGKEYYIKGSKGEKSYEIRFNRKSEVVFEIKLNTMYESKYEKVVLSIFNEMRNKMSVGYELNGETSNENIKYFVLKSNLKFNDQLMKMTLTTNFNVNKMNVADLELKFNSNKKGSEYELGMKYKGSYIITGKAVLDLNKIKFSHSIVVNDGKFKTELWSCNSKCKLTGGIECFLNHTNKARIINMGIAWTKTLNMLEFSWNKRKERGYIFMRKIEGQNRKITLSNPLSTLKIVKTKNQLYAEMIRKADPKRSMTFSIDYDMKGSLKTDYTLDILLKSGLLQKPLKISISRQISMNIGDLYVLSIKALFLGDQNPFFTLEGYLRQLSSRSYEMMLNATNVDKYITLTTKTSFTYEELSFEYTIDQKNEKSKEFKFKFIPFRKFLLKNNKDFKILMSRSIYQYGYRRDMELRLGKTGPNIVGYSTFVRNPFKYYTEVNGDGKKMVIHFRPVGNSFLGEMYRKVDGNKILDMSLKAELDNKNILSTNIYWNPKLLDVHKEYFQNIFKPQNIRAVIVSAYESSDYRWSTFFSGVKMDFIKRTNIENVIDFAKNVANDMEQIPTAYAEIYEDDDIYTYMIMSSAFKFLKSINFQEMINQNCNKMKASTASLFNQVYQWFINAQMYTSIYDSINNKLNAMSYNKVKDMIVKVMTRMQMLGRVINIEIDRVANILDYLSQRAIKAASMASNVFENIAYAFEGSKINEMIILMKDIKLEMIRGMGQFMETEFIKQRIIYYKDTITNAKEFIMFFIEMKNEALKYIRSSSLLGNILETMKFVKEMKYKEAFLNMIKREKFQFQMELDKAVMDIRFYVPPIVKPMLRMCKRISNWFPVQILSRLRGAGFGGKLLSLFYRYEYLSFNYGSMRSIAKLMPPFTKTAWVLGGNSILTYDGSSIKIGSGKCSYLLTREIKFGSLSLIMNINSESKLNEYIFSYIKEVKIISSGEITVDKKVISTLPQIYLMESKRIEIYRDHDTIKIKTSTGFIIEYFVNLDYLKVSVTGKWHGSMKGLLGSNDFDIINDWSTPDGRITHDAGILSKSWSIDKCDSQTKTGLYSIRVDPNQLQGCENLFKQDSMSYLTRCYSLIDPEPYYELCRLSLQYKKMNRAQFQELICDLSRNYVIRCKAKGMMIRLNKACINCGSSKLGGLRHELNLKTKPKFNYIFIIEQSRCLAPYKSLMEELLNMIALQKDNLYTLMSFNGHDIFHYAHFKSLNSEINTDSKGFKVLFSEFLSPSQLSSYENNRSLSEGVKSIYDAIKMPSKPGYIEKIIFVGCSACVQDKKYSFSILAGLLDNAGIPFTYLTTQSFTGQGSTENTAGLGNNMVHYFEQDKLQTRTWNKDLQPPQDVCSSLSRLNDGFVWSLKSLTSKMRLRRFAETLHSQLLKVTGNPKQKCVCGTGNYEDGKIECKVRGMK